jgi:adhesin transport system membrane fusion protein
MVAPMVERGSYSRVDYLNLQNQVISLQGEIETLKAALPKARAAAVEAEQRMIFREAELDTAIVDEINKRRSELASLRETLSAGGDRVIRTELRSPVRGTVRQVYLTTLGGVVKPGESIVDSGPLDDTLLVEARIRPADVAFLRPGQRAVVKISAYDFSIYGGLEGRLEQISADTIEDRRGELFYQVRVRTENTAIIHQGEELPIIPGMMATVDIMIGKKTILDYLLKPILKARQNALREK